MIESEIRDVYVCLCCEIRVCIYGDDDSGKLFFNVTAEFLNSVSGLLLQH